MKKLKFNDSLAIGIVIALIVVYVFYQCYSVTHIELRTETAVTTTVYESIDATALVVRDEQIVAGGSGVTVPTLSDGDKINVGGAVAIDFASNEDATAYSKYLDIQSQLDYYNELEAQTVGQAANVESINAKIDTNVDDYIRASANNNNLSKSADTLNSSLVQRQLIIGESVDFASITQELRKEAEELSSVANPSGVINTDVSGVFTSYTDGYEDVIDYSKAKEATIDDIKAATEKVAKKKDVSSNIGKLVTSYDWYMYMIVSTDDVKDLSNGQMVTIALKDNDDKVLRFKIIDGAEPAINTKETMLILECNDMDSEISSMRLVDVELRYDSYTGIKVPTEALHVVDGTKGVYALISSQVRFRQADVIYSQDDWVLLSYDEESKDGIRLYDKIIIQGKDLEDGKVYT